MTLPTNDNLSNRELCIEELEAVAAGGWFMNLVHSVEHGASVVMNDIASRLMWAGNHVPKFSIFGIPVKIGY